MVTSVPPTEAGRCPAGYLATYTKRRRVNYADTVGDSIRGAVDWERQQWTRMGAKDV